MIHVLGTDYLHVYLLEEAGELTHAGPRPPLTPEPRGPLCP